MVLESGQVLQAELVILAIGVVPENALAKQANLKVGPRGHIVTTANYEVYSGANDTVNPDIFAIGDAVEVVDFVTKTPTTAIPLAWPANRQGRLVADYINGKKIGNVGIQGTAVAKVLIKDASILRLSFSASTGSMFSSLIISSRCHCTVSIQFLAYKSCSKLPFQKGLFMGKSILSLI